MEELTMTPIVPGSDFAPSGASGPRRFPIYREDVDGDGQDIIIVPKHFGLSRFGAPARDMRAAPVSSSAFPAFNGELRPSQSVVVSRFLARARDPLVGGGIVTLPCGGGKTVIALKIVADLGCKALIVVHKEFLLSQWRERLSQFLPGASVGLVKAGVLDVEGRHVVLASVQSLSMKTYPPEAFADFGTLVVDECHRVGTEVFSRALFGTSFRYSVGLSATPDRKDGMTKAIVHHIGPALLVDSRAEASVCGAEASVCGAEDSRVPDAVASQDAIPLVRVRVVRFNSGNKTDYAREEIVHRRVATGAIKACPNLSRMINNICDFAPRTEFIADLVRETLAAEPSRRVLILSDRKSQLTALRDILASNIDVGFYWGGMKPDELRASAQCRVICATFPYAAEGMDIPELDTLVLASPKTDVVQSCGRITRRRGGSAASAAASSCPLVIDVVDTFSGIFVAQARKRARFYRDSGMLVLTRPTG
jgi:hypothetical protein